MDERIIEHLKLLYKYLGYLEKLFEEPREAFITDVKIRGASERYLQLAIESCLNIGSRVLAIQEAKTELTAPENYGDIFVKLGQLGVFSEEDVMSFVGMAKFRNKLVHGYWEIEPEKVYELIQNNMVDFYKFRDGIVRFLNGG